MFALFSGYIHHALPPLRQLGTRGDNWDVRILHELVS
jgi:hypothetical protein